jgi:tRNA pseudouridine32 synthase / 23S rRNA pseudouridine746 synthase
MLLADLVLFIDAEAMILDKPAGLAVDAPRDGSLSVMNHLDSLRFGFERHPSIVHRLDRDTSGCLLLARNPKSQKRFSAAFEAGTVEKTYLALNKVSTRETGWRMIPEPKGQRAVTHWETVTFGDGKALVRFRPETGRTHQLRVHAASGIGIAISGDPVYGVSGKHMLLHAERLLVPREGKEPAMATAALPAHFPDWARHAIG